MSTFSQAGNSEVKLFRQKNGTFFFASSKIFVREGKTFQELGALIRLWRIRYLVRDTCGGGGKRLSGSIDLISRIAILPST